MKKAKIILALAALTVFAAGCSASSQSTESAAAGSDVEKSTKTSGETLRVAVMGYSTSFINQYIVDQGWDSEEGIPFEVITFTSGPAINEAMAAGEWDVAITGGAAVFGIANYDALLVGYHMDGTGFNSILAREDNPVFDVQGYNPDYPEVYGSPETVIGSTILSRSGTTTQYIVNNWLNAVGVSPSDTENLNMEVYQIMTSFRAGDGDFASCTDGEDILRAADNGWKEVANLNKLGCRMYESLICTKDAYNNRYGDIVKFIELVYRAEDDMLADSALYAEYQRKWNEINAITSDDMTISQEQSERPVLGSARAKEIPLSEFMENIAQFYIDSDMLEPEKMDVIRANIVTDALEEALSRFD